MGKRTQMVVVRRGAPYCKLFDRLWVNALHRKSTTSKTSQSNLSIDYRSLIF